LDGVWKKIRAWGKAFGGSAEGGPPTRAGFLEEKKFCAILRADESGGDDFGVVEYQNILRGEQAGKILDEVIGKALGLSLDQEKACRVTWPGRLGGNLIGGQMIGQKSG
jgi:hypothetical protein